MTVRARRVLLALAAAPIAVVLAYAAVPPFRDMGGRIFNAYNLSALLSAVVLVIAVFVRRPRPVWPWLLIVAAEILWVAGDAVYIWIGDVPVLSFADALYIPGYLGLILALMFFVRSQVRQRDVDSLIDVAMLTIAAGLALWELVVQPSWDAAGDSQVTQIMTTIYPLLDVMLLCLLVQLLLVPGRRSVSLILLAAGMGAIFVGDTIYAILVQNDAYRGEVVALLDLTWLGGYALFPVAALHPSMNELTLPAAGDDAMRRGRLFIAGLSLVMVPAAMILTALLGRDPGVETIALAATLIVPLMLARMVRLNRSNERARADLASQERYYRTVATFSSDAYVIIGIDATVIDASVARESIVGYGRGTVIGANALTIVEPDDRELAEALLRTSLANPATTITDEVRLRTADGVTLWAELRCTNLVDDPAVRGLVVNAHDTSTRKAIEQELAHNALHDSLTGLANRALLKNRTEPCAVEAGSRRRSRDRVLRSRRVQGSQRHARPRRWRRAAHRRRSTTRRRHPPERHGRPAGWRRVRGAPGGLRRLAEEAGVVAERMRSALSDPVVINGLPLVVTGSFGVAVASEGGQETTDDLLRDADTAMYLAKAAGRNRVTRYEPSMRIAALSRVELETDLQHAVERGELALE
jgi:PAS domain S-box-containing protein